MSADEAQGNLLQGFDPPPKDQRKTVRWLSIFVGVFALISIVLAASIAFVSFSENRGMPMSTPALKNEVYINEYSFEANRNGNPAQMVELYNSKNDWIDLSGYFIRGNLPSTEDGKEWTSLKKIPDGTHLGPKATVTFWFPEDTFAPSEGKLWLLDPSQFHTIDTVSYSTARKTAARIPDGGWWTKTSAISPNESNKHLRTASPSTHVAGAFEIHIFNVGQGDSQLIIFPSGYTVLIDCNEPNWNSAKGAKAVEAKVQTILGTNRPHIDVGIVSHLHLDHLGYSNFGGFWYLIEVSSLTFGKIIERDAGRFVDANGDGECDPDTEIVWANAGTYSGTATKWLCYSTNPANNKIYPIREVAELCSTQQINPPDDDVTVTIVTTDGIGATTLAGQPLTGDHTEEQLPPSENDYSISLRIQYGSIVYVTTGDLDGDYATSSFGYAYNDVEAVAGPRIGSADIYRAGHHGSSHSSSEGFVQLLDPMISVFSCGFQNSYGHPAPAVMDRLLDKGDVWLTSECNPSTKKYNEVRQAHVSDSDILIRSTNGVSFTVTDQYGESPSYQTRSKNAPTCRP